MKKKTLIIVICAMLIGGLLFYVGVKSGLTGGTQTANPLHTEKSIEDLEKKLGWTLSIPEFVTKEKDITCESLLGNMAIISNNRLVFRAAKDLKSPEVDINGEYTEYELDRTYEVSNNPIKNIRYRTDGKTTLVNYALDDMNYGIKMLEYDGYNGQSALLKELGIGTEDIKETQEISSMGCSENE